MATFDKSNVVNGNVIQSNDVLQLFNALDGTTSYNVNIKSGIFSGSFSGSFKGDGSQLTGIIAEWDGSRNGDSSITGSFYVSKSNAGYFGLDDVSTFLSHINSVSGIESYIQILPNGNVEIFPGNEDGYGMIKLNSSNGSTVLGSSLNTANGSGSIAQGYNTITTGYGSHAEGNEGIANGDFSHAEGESTRANGYGSHAEGGATFANGADSHAEGYLSVSEGQMSHAEGYNATSSANYSHAEGLQASSRGLYSHAEGSTTIASGSSSHAEGLATLAFADFSHAEGSNTLTLGQTSHAEGESTKAEGSTSHAEGLNTWAFGEAAHSEGRQTTASGDYSHAEGFKTIASGLYSHAEGSSSIAYGIGSHAEGLNTIASGNFQSVVGKFNLHNNTSSVFVVGIGSNTSNRIDGFKINTDVNGSGSILINADIQFVSKSIDTSAGDAITINSPVGRFRKDTSGTTFVLTNKYITTNSIIILQYASDPGVTGFDNIVSSGMGSCSITFTTSGVPAAPTNNTDMNFLIFN
jgi:hypothetical protein